MQNNPLQQCRRSSTSPPRSHTPDTANQPTTSRMQDLPLHPHQPRFIVTPKTVGMDIALLQPRQQQESSTPTRPESTAQQQTSCNIKPCTTEQLEQSHTSYQNMTNIKDEPATDVRHSEAATGSNTAGCSYKPSCLERRPSTPVSPTSTYSHDMAGFAPTLSSTMAMPCRPASGMPAGQNVSSPSTPTNERQSSQSNQGAAAQHPTLHFEQQLEKFRSGSNFFGGGAVEINSQLNEIFIDRLNDIDAHGQGDNNLKLVTYQEWVDMLLKINESILSNVQELESEVAKRLDYVQQRVSINCRHSQGNEVMKCRKDIDTLMKLIQNGYHYNAWDMHDITFETVTPAQVFGLTDQKFEMGNIEAGLSQMGSSSEAECMQRNKLLANMKALALEVAEKHDEVRELKRQVVALEDDVQKAQMRIQFKSDVIKRLRDDLKLSGKVTSPQSGDSSMVMPPINFENESQRANQTGLAKDCSCQLESLSQGECLEEQHLSVLNEELDEMFEIIHQQKQPLAEKERNRLSKILHKSESEKVAAYHKLDYIRHQLINLENSAISSVPTEAAASNDGDSGFSSKNENDQDSKILGALRKRLRDLIESNCDLRNRVKKLERENNELSTDLKAAETISKRNDSTLKHVADLLCSVTGNSLSYTDIYKDSSQCQMNPFCEAIMEMKRAQQQREAQLLEALSQKNQKIEQLMEQLINRENDPSEHHKHRVNLSEGEDIDNITPPSSLSMQLPAQQTTPAQHFSTHTSYAKDTLSDEQAPRRQP